MVWTQRSPWDLHQSHCSPRNEGQEVPSKVHFRSAWCTFLGTAMRLRHCMQNSRVSVFLKAPSFTHPCLETTLQQM